MGWHDVGETGRGDGDNSIAARKCQPFFPLRYSWLPEGLRLGGHDDGGLDL